MYQSKARRDYCPNIYCADGTGKNNIPKPDKMSTVHTVLWQILVFLDLFFKALESNSKCTKFKKKTYHMMKSEKKKGDVLQKN